MRENPYKRLPPIERKQDGSLYRMTPAQRKQANPLIRRECCNYEDGNCMLPGRWGRPHLPPGHFFLGLLQVVPLVCLTTSGYAGSRDFPGKGLEML